MRIIKKISFVYFPMDMKRRYGADVKEVGIITPPLGLLYLAAMLEKHGYLCQIIDADVQGLRNGREILSYLQRFNPDFIGIYLNTANFNTVMAQSKIIKESFNVPICLGGPHATIDPAGSLASDGIDYIVIGEGEITIVELIKALNNQDELSKVNGLAYREAGEVIVNQRRALLEDLDQLPFPARHLVPIHRYNPDPFKPKQEPISRATTMMSSRGCPYGCTFCSSRSTWGRKYRLRSVKNVIAEIESLINEYEIKRINFWDDLWGLDNNWVENFCQAIIDSELDITWTAEARVDSVELETLKLMKKAGCDYLFFGLESFDQEILDALEKGVRVEQIWVTIRNAKKAGIKTVVNFIIGSPLDTPQKTIKTIKKVKKLKPDYAKFNLFTPYPGTVAYNQIKTGKWGGTINENWEGYTSYFPIFLPEGYSSFEELGKMYRYAIRKFYLRPAYIWSKLKMIKGIGDIKYYLAGMLAIIKRAILK